MDFHDLEAKLLRNFQDMQGKHGAAYRTDAEKEMLWNTYLESFPAKVNPVFRKRREFDCSCCRHFIYDIGGIVLIDDNYEVHTLWEFDVDDTDYQVVLDALDSYVRSRSITDVYLSPMSSVGTKQSHEVDEHGNVRKWEHFWLPLPEAYRYTGSATLQTALGQRRDIAHVFERSLNEISLYAIDTVLELSTSNTLYKGAEWIGPLSAFRDCKTAFDQLPAEKKAPFAWKVSGQQGPVVGKIRNHSIGVLLTDISQGVEINEAVRRYERIVAPANYKRSKPIYTARMIEDAKRRVMEMGYGDSLLRRFARLDDITVNNILFSNKDAAKRIRGSVFDDLVPNAAKSTPKFDRVEEIPIDRFIENVLPRAREIEAFVENRHAPNMCSLIAPVNGSAPSMFKWKNPFSWAYTGNMTDSNIRENVKAAGGSVTGVLRFSIQWNDTSEYSMNDLDAHCFEPTGEHIFFGHKISHAGTRGNLDVDIIHPEHGVPAVENITWPNLSWMPDGKYEFKVHQYTNRGGKDGFRAEIAFEGKTYNFNYPHELRQGEVVTVANVYLKNGKFTIEEVLPSRNAPTSLWGVTTMQFVPVTVVMLSPNYWDQQSGIGNKHYMFMLKGCVNPEHPNGFYNEFLRNELYEHRRVFEALGSKMAVEETEDQLSGLGFSSTLRNDLIVRVKGETERIMKVKF